jgi:hypothetical protein
MRLSKLVLAILAVLGVLTSRAMADIQLTLTGTLNNNGWNMGGVYTSPYMIQVGNSNVSVLALACDDFTTDINFGDSWWANSYGLNDVTNSGPQKFGGPLSVSFPNPSTTTSYSAQAAYDAAAFLTQSLLFDSSVSTSQYWSGIYSYAIWQIFYNKAYLGWGGNQLTAQEVKDVTAKMNWAFGQVTSGAQLNYDLVIYTPCGTSDAQCKNNPSNTVSQEFLGMTPKGTQGTVPEGSPLPSAGFDVAAILAGGVVVWVRRRRLARKVTGCCFTPVRTA